MSLAEREEGWVTATATTISQKSPARTHAAGDGSDRVHEKKRNNKRNISFRDQDVYFFISCTNLRRQPQNVGKLGR